MNDVTFTTTSGSGYLYPAFDSSFSIKNALFAGCMLSTGFALIPAENLIDTEIEQNINYGLHQFFDNKIDSSRSLDTNLILGDKNEAKELADELTVFYQSLASKQESLGVEFENVLYQNIEELYL